jgi:hypothetical protein
MNQVDAASKRRTAILVALRTPKTLKELEEETHCKYHTIWRALKPLREAGVIEECTWRRGREAVYVATNQNEDGVTYITTEAGALPVGAWAEMDQATMNNTLLAKVRDIPRSLAQAWRYSKYSALKTLEQANAGSMDPGECKAALRKSLEHLRTLELAVEQMLLADIWAEATPDNADKFGVTDPAQVLENGAQFERMHGRG